MNEDYCKKLIMECDKYGIDKMSMSELEHMMHYCWRNGKDQAGDYYESEVLRRDKKVGISWDKKEKTVSDCNFFSPIHFIENNTDKTLLNKNEKLLKDYEQYKAYLKKQEVNQEMQNQSKEKSNNKNYNPYTKNRNY